MYFIDHYKSKGAETIPVESDGVDSIRVVVFAIVILWGVNERRVAVDDGGEIVVGGGDTGVGTGLVLAYCWHKF